MPSVCRVQLLIFNIFQLMFIKFIVFSTIYCIVTYRKIYSVIFYLKKCFCIPRIIPPFFVLTLVSGVGLKGFSVFIFYNFIYKTMKLFIHLLNIFDNIYFQNSHIIYSRKPVLLQYEIVNTSTNFHPPQRIQKNDFFGFEYFKR